MDATKLLEHQHAEVRDLFAEYQRTSDGRTKRSIFLRIADNLAAHSEIEEQIFYPAAYEDETEDLLREAVEEHLSVKRLLADLLEMSMTDDHFDAKMTVLEEQVEHHVEEEEGDLFGKVRRAMDSDRLEQLGAEMHEMFEDLIGESPRYQIPSETDEAPPLA